MRPGRLALVATSTAYVVALGWAAVVLPERVPSHFDGGGRVDDWSDRATVLVFWAVAGLVVLAGVPALGRLTTRGDGTWVNMPQASKDYWFATERKAEFRVRFGDDLEGFAAMTGVLLVAGLAMTTWVAAGDRDGVPWWLLAGGLGAYLAAAAAWTVRLLRTYRPPS